MGLLKSALKVQTFVWDFDKDGGLQGDYPTGIVLSKNMIFTNIMFEIVTPIGNPGSSSFAYGIASSIGSFGSTGALGPDPVLRINSVAITPAIYVVVNNQEIIFSIGIADITAGVIKSHFVYIESIL